MKSYKVVWTTQAAVDLEEIVDYIALDNPRAAIRLFEKVRTLCLKLKTTPERNRVVPELKDIGIFHYREVVVKPYRVLYKLAESTVYVFAVVDGRRDMESFLFRRLIRD